MKAQLKEARLEQQRQQWRLEWERKEEERRRREAEAARAQLLIKLSERWMRAEQLRAFIAAVEEGGQVPAALDPILRQASLGS